MNNEEFSAYWNSRKEYIHKDLWVIRNFLTPEELALLDKEARDPDGWYTTMRSTYGGNIRNKFILTIPRYNENGIMVLPDSETEFNDIKIFQDLDGIDRRANAVLPDYYRGCAAFQSIFEVPLEDTPRNAIEDDFAMPYHYENDNAVRMMNDEHPKLTASFLIYINDDFDGGELRFKNLPDIVIKPEPGMMINVPLTEEFEHKISRVYNGNRHSLYGNCWDREEGVHLSSNDDC